MSVSVPLSVKVLVPLAPALMVAAPLKVTVTVPCVTVSWVVARLPSTSVTLIRLGPVIANAVSSSTLTAAGAVFTGASLILLTVILTTSMSFNGTPALSVLVTVSVSGPL